MVAPARAAALARSFRPGARFILIGHTHYCGCSPRGPRIVINTGSFMPLGGRMTVDIQGDSITVRPILRQRGTFHAGPPVARFTASRLLPGEAP
jgi:hypothetical protein